MTPSRPATKHALPEAPEICRLPAVELVDAVRRRRLSAREVVQAFLDRIETANPLVNAIVSLRDRAAILREADDADGRAAKGDAGALCGLPVAVKDLALTRGLRTTFGSPAFADFVPDEDEFFVERMKKAGAIVIGKSNVPEFGLGSNTYNPVFGSTLNAFDPAWTAGGSSGGAAVALALHMVPLADGRDFGGPPRHPPRSSNGYRPGRDWRCSTRRWAWRDPWAATCATWPSCSTCRPAATRAHRCRTMPKAPSSPGSNAPPPAAASPGWAISAAICPWRTASCRCARPR